MALFRWMRRRAKCCCLSCCGAIVFIIISLGLFGHHMYKKEHCTEKEQIIEDLCKLYKNKDVAGSLCSDLCDTGTIHYQTCANYEKGKKVLFLTCDTCVPDKTLVNIVMKMRNDLVDREKLDMSYIELDSADRLRKYNQEIENLVRNSFLLLNHQNMSNHKDILSFAWGWNFQDYIDNNKDNKEAVVLAAASLWSLVDQHEYLMSRDLHNNSFTPKLYGTCGPAYFVENTQTLHNYQFEILKGWTLWQEKATIALKLIDLTFKLDNLSQRERLHLCDIKADNFGLRDNGEVTLIDTDSAMFEKNLLMQFNFTNCTSHDDCDVLDCRGFCDTKTNRCFQERSNDNMQAICERVFVGYFHKMPTGLLRDPPGSIKVELFKLLQECSNPGVETEWQSARRHAQPHIVKQLKQILRQSIGEQ